MPLDVRVGGDENTQGNKAGAIHRPFLGVKFICANGAYNRFYKNPDQTAYVGRCPDCLREVSIGIGSHGTSARFFTYDCGMR